MRTVRSAAPGRMPSIRISGALPVTDLTTVLGRLTVKMPATRCRRARALTQETSLLLRRQPGPTAGARIQSDQFRGRRSSDRAMVHRRAGSGDRRLAGKTPMARERASLTGRPSHCWRGPTAVPCLHPIRVEAPWGFPRMGTADGVASGCSNSSGEDHVAGMRQGSPTINRSDAAATTPLPRHGKDTVVTSRGQNLAAPCLKDHLVPSHGLPVPGRRYGLEPIPPQRVAVAG